MPYCLRNAVLLTAIGLAIAGISGCFGGRGDRLPDHPATILGGTGILPDSTDELTIVKGRADKDAAEVAEAPAAGERPPAKPAELRMYRFGLEEAVKWAIANNLSLMNARDQVARSRFNVQAAAADFEVKIIPKANAGLSGGSAGTTTTTGSGLELDKKMGIGTSTSLAANSTKMGDFNTTAVGIQVTQPLLRGLGKEVNERALLDAEFGVVSSERSFVEFEESLTVSTVRGFYEIIRQRELLDLNRKSAERTRNYVRAAEARENAGLASRIDVLRAQIQLRQAEDSLLEAEQAYGDAVDGLKVLLGFGPQDDVDINADLSFNEFTIDQDQAIIMAMTNRLDLAQSQDEIFLAERNVRVARNNKLPQLDLVLGYQQSGTGSSFSDSSALKDSTWTIGLATSTDIRRSAERARYEQSKLDLESRRRNEQFLKDIIVREVKDALRRLEKNRKKIDVQRTEIEHAQQKLKLAKMKFDKGLGDNFDLITAEEETIRAESNYIGAVTDYIVSQAEVKRAIGTLIEKPARLLK